MPAPVLMIQGTMSSVGKSWLTTALCRIFARQGLRVAPFKAQNMSNNAAVCPDGSEIGRAQALQARAAGITPTATLNPILLKPEADHRSQVVVLGKPWRTLSARTYYQYKPQLWSVVTTALDHLRAHYDLVIAEGAGSPAELNLRGGDVVNMAVARYAQATVLLVGDIDRGGIFAQLLGTLDLLPPEERALVRGLVVNKFRGDPALFTDGVRILEQRSGLPVLGVVPYLSDVLLPEEDAAPLDASFPQTEPSSIDIAVVHLPHIANYDDFDPLRAEPGVRVRFVKHPARLGRPHAIILPGTKSTLADLAWLRRSGWAQAIVRHARQGGAVVGICGGYQMLGEEITDPAGVESQERRAAGLGLLPIHTTFATTKATFQTQAQILGGPAWLQGLAGTKLAGYEIHLGRSPTPHPWLEIIRRNGQPTQVADGCVSPDGRVWGSYLHGIFGNSAFRQAWLAFLRQAASAGSLRAPSLATPDYANLPSDPHAPRAEAPSASASARARALSTPSSAPNGENHPARETPWGANLGTSPRLTSSPGLTFGVGGLGPIFGSSSTFGPASSPASFGPASDPASPSPASLNGYTKYPDLEEALERLADTVARHLDLGRLWQWLFPHHRPPTQP